MTRRRFSFAVWLAVWLLLTGVADVLAVPIPMSSDRAVTSDTMSGATWLAQAQPTPVAPLTPAAPAAAATTDTQTANDEPIGNVATLVGNATVTRNDQATALKPKDDIFLNDVLQTSANSSLGVTFNDATTFNLTANSRITVDSFVYDDGGKQNAALFDITRGTVAFVAAAVAKTGDMKISTPTATLGIRGTTGLVEVPEGAATNSRNNVAIKLYPDPDGKVGRIEVNDRAGVRLGFLTQGASGFTIRPGAGGRFAATPLLISPQQALRDQGFVRQVHSTQNLGRRVVTEQRALRRANPASNNPNRANQPRPGGPQRQNNLPGQNRPGLQQQPGVPNRQGLPAQPGSPAQPGVPPRTGQPQQPGTPAQPGVQQGQPASPNRPGAPPQPGLQPPGVQQGAPAPGLRRPGLQRPGLPGQLPKRPPPKRLPKIIR